MDNDMLARAHGIRAASCLVRKARRLVAAVALAAARPGCELRLGFIAEMLFAW
jgi:hypothetical protein